MQTSTRQQSTWIPPGGPDTKREFSAFSSGGYFKWVQPAELRENTMAVYAADALGITSKYISQQRRSFKDDLTLEYPSLYFRSLVVENKRTDLSPDIVGEHTSKAHELSNN